MNPAFGLQVAIRVFTGYEKSDRFDSRLVSLLDINDLAVESAPLDPSLVHSTKHIRPIARLCSPCAGVNREKGVVLIELTRKEHFQLETLQLSYQGRVLLLCFPKGRYLRSKLFFLSCKANKDLQILHSLNECGEGLHL